MGNGDFVNKVQASGIVALDLIDYKPTIEIVEFDIKNLLFMGMIVKEKEFKEALSQVNLDLYKGKAIAFVCSVDAIVPPWVYMVLADKFHANATYFDFKDPASMELELWKSNLMDANFSVFKDKKVVVRARGDIPPSLYMIVAGLLKPIVKSLMYGEVGLPKVIYKR